MTEFNKTMDLTATEVPYKTQSYEMQSAALQRELSFQIFIPKAFEQAAKISLLLFNDGQEFKHFNYAALLDQANRVYAAHQLVSVLIHAGAARTSEYGVAAQVDYKGRGDKAGDYAAFITQELYPFLEQELPFKITGHKVFAGFSLGGISAFDIAWHQPEIFDAVGVFSGSFWWRTKALNEGYTDQDRIVHQMIDNSSNRPKLKFWLMTGSEDELLDRNRNGIIDSIDDTIDVIKALLKKGYRRPQDITYYELIGGKHDWQSWAKAMPAFLSWVMRLP